jgi:sRNA-binding carbon storage regulator CsrA
VLVLTIKDDQGIEIDLGDGEVIIVKLVEVRNYSKARIGVRAPARMPIFQLNPDGTRNADSVRRRKGNHR